MSAHAESSKALAAYAASSPLVNFHVPSSSMDTVAGEGSADAEVATVRGIATSAASTTVAILYVRRDEMGLMSSYFVGENSELAWQIPRLRRRKSTDATSKLLQQGCGSDVDGCRTPAEVVRRQGRRHSHEAGHVGPMNWTELMDGESCPVGASVLASVQRGRAGF